MVWLGGRFTAPGPTELAAHGSQRGVNNLGLQAGLAPRRQNWDGALEGNQILSWVWDWMQDGAGQFWKAETTCKDLKPQKRSLSTLLRSNWARPIFLDPGKELFFSSYFFLHVCEQRELWEGKEAGMVRVTRPSKEGNSVTCLAMAGYFILLIRR